MMSCPFCSCKRSFDLGWEIYICSNCGTIFKGNFVYKKSYYNDIEIHGQPEIPGLCKHWADDMVRVIREDAGSGFIFQSVLDIGCDRGYFLDRLCDRYVVAGCDIENRMERRHPYFATFDEIQGAFDVVAMVSTIEHLNAAQLRFLSITVKRVCNEYIYIATNSPKPITVVLNDLKYNEHHAITNETALGILFGPEFQVVKVNHRVDYFSTYLLSRKVW